MKIALCGANNTGKTTLATELHKVLGVGFNLITYSRPTAAARSLGYESPRDVPDTFNEQWIFQLECLFEQIRAQRKAGNNYIADRSTLDPLAFLNYKLPFTKLTIHHDMYQKFAFEFCDYDHLFFVPNFGGEMEDNGVRLLTPQEPVEAEFAKLFDRLGKSVYTVKSKSVSNRVAEVCEVLKI